MKNYLIIALISISPLLAHSQSSDSTGRFGIAINSSVNGALYPIRIVPSLTYSKAKSQVQLGVGVHPMISKKHRMLSGELNYKYFPNGTENKFNMYLVSRLSFVNDKRETYYPSTYNYLFLNGGYGFDVHAFAGAFIGMNVSSGIYTNNKKSDIPYPSFASIKMFDQFDWNLAFQFNIRYEF